MFKEEGAELCFGCAKGPGRCSDVIYTGPELPRDDWARDTGP